MDASGLPQPARYNAAVYADLVNLGLLIRMTPFAQPLTDLCCLCGANEGLSGEHKIKGIRILVWEDRTSPSCLTALVR